VAVMCCALRSVTCGRSRGTWRTRGGYCVRRRCESRRSLAGSRGATAGCVRKFAGRADPRAGPARSRVGPERFHGDRVRPHDDPGRPLGDRECLRGGHVVRRRAVHRAHLRAGRGRPRAGRGSPRDGRARSRVDRERPHGGRAGPPGGHGSRGVARWDGAPARATCGHSVPARRARRQPSEPRRSRRFRDFALGPPRRVSARRRGVRYSYDARAAAALRCHSERRPKAAQARHRTPPVEGRSVGTLMVPTTEVTEDTEDNKPREPGGSFLRDPVTSVVPSTVRFGRASASPRSGRRRFLAFGPSALRSE
jgi:hypothetical protein